MTTHPHLEGLNKLADDMNEWLCDPFVNLTPMRHMDVENFIGRLRTIANEALAALPGGGVDEARYARGIGFSWEGGGQTTIKFDGCFDIPLGRKYLLIPTPTPHEADRNG